MNHDETTENSTKVNGTMEHSKFKQTRVDKGALDGLRGLFAFHIMAFHACLFMGSAIHPTVNLYGSVDMPLFFLLSGFSLTLAYGKTLWNGSTRCCLGCKTTSLDGTDIENPGTAPKIFDSWEFYKKRFVRILPLHYLGHILVLMVWKFGVWREDWEEMYIGGLLSIFAINTWLLPYVNFGPNGSSWTICTLSFWYWCFPFILPRMQRWTDKELAHGMVKTFWLSVALSLMVYVGFGEVNWKKATEDSYWVTTAHPLFRFPVFLLGMLGGLQVVRAHNNQDAFEDPNLNKNLLHVLLPWGYGGSNCCHKSDEGKKDLEIIDRQKSRIIWKKRVDFGAFFYVGLITALIITEISLDTTYRQKDLVFLTGAHRNDKGRFVWPNGTSEEFYNYTNFDEEQCDDEEGTCDCEVDEGWCETECLALMGLDSRGYKWYPVGCDRFDWDPEDLENNLVSGYRFICQYDEKHGHCNSTDENSGCFEGTFYNISDFTASYENANKFCEENAGTLLIENNQNITHFIVNLIHNTVGYPLNEHVAYFFKTDWFWNPFLQYFLVHVQLTVIVGLCMDDGKSITSKFLRTRIMQFLGRISLSLYLLHISVMGFVLLAINGPSPWNSKKDIWDAFRRKDLIEPPGTPLIVIIASPIVAFIATKYFEEPIAKILKGQK